MIKILIVDDEVKIREVVKEYAKVSNFECSEARNGKEAIDAVRNKHFDCVILDIMMPEIDGFSACKKIKEIDKDTSIIMLSARNEEDDKLYSFEMGVDDYVTKPFSPKELMARIKAVCDRGKKDNEKYSYEDLLIDISGRSVYIDNKKVEMTPKELDLLIFLVKHEGVALDRDELLSSVWHYEYSGDDRTIDSHIKMLRKSLGKYRDLIKTVRSMGYKFEI